MRAYYCAHVRISEDFPDYETAKRAITRILALSVNGCMTEMGLFPGIAQLLEDARQENFNIHQQADQYRADNVNLSRIINEQREHLENNAPRASVDQNMEILSLRAQLNQVISERNQLLCALDQT